MVRWSGGTYGVGNALRREHGGDIGRSPLGPKIRSRSARISREVSMKIPKPARGGALLTLRAVMSEGCVVRSYRRENPVQVRRRASHYATRGNVEGNPNVPSTTSTKFLSSRRIIRMLCAAAKFSRAFGSAFSRPRYFFVRGKAIEGDQTPGYVIGALVRKEIPTR